MITTATPTPDRVDFSQHACQRFTERFRIGQPIHRATKELPKLAAVGQIVTFELGARRGPQLCSTVADAVFVLHPRTNGRWLATTCLHVFGPRPGHRLGRRRTTRTGRVKEPYIRPRHVDWLASTADPTECPELSQ